MAGLSAIFFAAHYRSKQLKAMLIFPPWNHL